ncbi:TPA: hypothetical protein U5D73_000081 [Yersinia enterocolitica]|uniref:hypothetical protein n=1 Tax=Yersinia mollaretii TaxID=33060 RepID=UPI0005E6C659|nr:hypothetical protein [Yersinia mollaretii]CQR03824.1 Uncharacterised protein [Yersinia mollaretii]HEN3447698.1 hypothetical protein [Yersinia enterocolitica]
MSVFKIFVQVILIASVLALGYFMSSYVKYSSVTDILSGLQNASAMIFAIAGIWLAYLYPNAIAGLVKNEKVDFFASKSDAKRVESMVFIIVTSAFVLVAVITFYVLSAVIKNTDFYVQNRTIMKTIGLGYVLYLYMVQIYCVLMVIARNLSFVSRLHSILNDKELDEKL